MAWFTEDTELNNSKDPFETLDPPPPDFSFADSLLDFDSIQSWFDSSSSPDMPPLLHSTTKLTHSDPSIHMVPPTVLPRLDPIEVPQRDQLVTLSDTIEEGIGKISLAGGSEKPLGNGGYATQCQGLVGGGESSESGNPSTSSSLSPSSTSPASSCRSDSVGHGDDDQEESTYPDKKGEVINEELEEGEIRGSADVRELVIKTAVVDDDEGEDYEKMVGWSDMNDADEDEDDDASGGPIRSKNELEVLPSVPQVDVTLEPRHQMLPVGVVTSVMGSKLIVEGLEKHDPLDEGSILWMSGSRTPLGFVDEVFGPVRNPYYVVRYNSANEVPRGIYEGALISFVPEFANPVLNEKDLYKKGYDASGVNDEEVTDELEFSDDEKEAEYRRMQKLTERGINHQNRRNRKANRKKVSQNARAKLAMPLLNQGNSPTLLGVGHGHDGTNTIAPPFSFPHTNLNPLTASNSQPALLPNGLPPNGAPWFPQNAWNSHQFPAPAIAFRHQFTSSQGSLSTNMIGGVLPPNAFAQPAYAAGLVGQKQITPGSSSLSHSLRFHPPNCSGENQMHFQGNHNLRPGTTSVNSHFSGQFRPGSSAGRGRKTPHRGGRRDWSPIL
ncbi:H/ACA ribonucleoprotein complex non-core subunit NAF1-like [Neltuma alba]|uniref:H/ACA ribonucleoprotein complex non-core subunit NAF1-like n=1 Tax=Neltuma alba TaxID=207710 RepID=UPI0010A43C23|nr:H/ACA ribonucleoprotein complex non-core subunit NAF1-like [Prosopis alba]